jgi:hypothetical protein
MPQTCDLSLDCRWFHRTQSVLHIIVNLADSKRPDWERFPSFLKPFNECLLGPGRAIVDLDPTPIVIVSHGCFQRCILFLETADLIRGGISLSVSGSSILAGIQKDFGPFIVNGDWDSMPATDFRNRCFAPETLQNDPDLFLGSEFAACGFSDLFDNIGGPGGSSI